MKTRVSTARILDQGARGPCPRRNDLLRAAVTPWVLLLDEDAEPEPGCLERLLAAADEHPRAAAISPRVLDASEPPRLHYDGARIHFLAELCFENAGRPLCDAREPSRRPGAAATTALLVHRERALEAGLFDEAYLFFREDLDFSLRLRACGWDVLHCEDATVRHDSRRRGVLHRSRTRLQTRNRWRTILKVYETRTILLTLPLQAAYEALNLGSALLRGEPVQYALAWYDLLRSAPALMRDRERFQALRRRGDRELLACPPLTWSAAARALPGAGPARRVAEAVCLVWWQAASPLLR